MPFQRRQKCLFHWRGRAWLTIWDRVKIARCSHKLMHRKRVTCELHDSNFRSMTIKHAIPKTAEVKHFNDQLWGDIEWAIELLYNSVRQEVSQFRDQRVFGGQTSLGIRRVVEMMLQRKQHSADSWAPGPPVEQQWRTRKTQRWWP